MPVKHFISMIRPLNCVMAAFGTFIGYSIGHGFIHLQPELNIAMLVAFLVCAGGMVLNDYFDRFVDRKLHPEKPLPSGKIGAESAILYAVALFFVGNVLAFLFLSKTSFLIAFAFTVLLILYSRFLPQAKYIGNWVVASGTAFTLVFGASLINSYAIVLFFAFAALFANLARELIKDLEDVKADTGYKKSLPMLLSEKKVILIVLLYYLLAIALVYLPAFLGFFAKPAFLAVVSIANWLFILSLAKTVEKKFKNAQFISKIAMLIALIGFLLGVV